MDREDEIRAELVLDLNRALGREAHDRPVQMRIESHAVVVNLVQRFAVGLNVAVITHRLHTEKYRQFCPPRHESRAKRPETRRCLSIADAASS